jgi:probable lipoprotein NlpC
MSPAAFALAAACCCGAAGCISSSVRYGQPAGPEAARREERREAAADEGDFGALLADDGAGGTAAAAGDGRVVKTAKSYLGTPYHYGGLSRRGIDCSGLVVLVFRESAGISLPHSSRRLHRMGKKIRLADTKPGDLLFFRMGFGRFVDHVGICTGNASFIHASSKLGVIESSMNDGHYRTHFIEARRVLP